MNKRAFSIEWHINCLNNYEKHYKEKREEYIRLQQELARMSDEIEFRKFQIEEAKKKGKTSFDPERFCAKNRIDKED